MRNIDHLKKILGDVSVAPAPELGTHQTIPESFQDAKETSRRNHLLTLSFEGETPEAPSDK